MTMIQLPVSHTEEAFQAPSTVILLPGESTIRRYREATDALARYSFSAIQIGAPSLAQYDIAGFGRHQLTVKPGGVCILRSEAELSGEYVETDVTAAFY